MGDDIYSCIRRGFVKSSQAAPAGDTAGRTAGSAAGPSAGSQSGAAAKPVKSPAYRQGMTYGPTPSVNEHGYADKPYVGGARDASPAQSYALNNGGRGYGIRYLTGRPDVDTQSTPRAAWSAAALKRPKAVDPTANGRKYIRDPNLEVGKPEWAEAYQNWLERNGHQWMAAGFNDAFTGLQRVGNEVAGGLTGTGMFLGKWLDPRSWGSSARALKNREEWDNMRADRADMHADIEDALKRNYEMLSEGDLSMKLHNISNTLGSVGVGGAVEMLALGGLGRAAKGVSGITGRAVNGGSHLAGRMAGSVAGRVGAEATAFRSHFGQVGRAIDKAYSQAVANGWKGSKEQLRLMFVKGINSPSAAVRARWAGRLGLNPKFTGIGHTGSLVARDIARGAVRNALSPLSPRAWMNGVVRPWRTGPITTWTGLAGKGKAVLNTATNLSMGYNTVNGLYNAATGNFGDAARSAVYPVVYGLSTPVGRYAGGGLLGQALRYGTAVLPWLV